MAIEQQISGNQPFAVGTHVKVQLAAEPDQPRDQRARESGVIMEDFGDTTAHDPGRTWALSRRWAIALDNGRLVFADTDDLELA